MKDKSKVDEDSWNRYLPYLRDIAARATRRTDMGGIDPSSIAQVAATEAWKSRGSFRGEGEEAFLAWMRGILANIVRATVRSHIRRPQCVDLRDVSVSSEYENNRRIAVFATSETCPVEALEKREQSMRLSQSLDQLSADHRQVLMARHYEDCSFAEIAEKMNRSEAATRMLWIRALQELRTAYRTQGK